MKNKKSIFILLPLVLLIWGLVGYQFFSFTDPEADLTAEPLTALQPLNFKTKDTFEVKVGNRDPFLGKITAAAKPKATSTAPRIRTTTVKASATEELVWPTVQYKGLISDTKEKKKVYLLIINGRTFLMKKGETAAGVTLSEATKDNVRLKYEGKSGVFPLK